MKPIFYTFAICRQVNETGNNQRRAKMTYRNQLGARWLHRVNNKTPHTRIWGERECGLRRLAEKMKDEGIPFNEIISRITELR